MSKTASKTESTERVGRGNVSSNHNELLTRFLFGTRRVRLLQVKDLEDWIDRDALLRDDTPEPPYWALVWTGAHSLARYVEDHVACAGRSVLDLGCGLGLTGIVASLKGGRVTFADHEPQALAFARANAELNGCCGYRTQQLDFSHDTLAQRFSLILGAEIVYDRSLFSVLIDFVLRHLTPDGSALLADAHRTNTDEFYRQLDARGLAWTRTAVQEREDNLPLTVHLVTVRQGER